MNAQQLKNAILQEAIEGRLVPQDPNDEPASVLLDKIRKEKARLVKEGKLKKKDLDEKPISEDEIPFEIPENWEWCRVSDISESFIGLTYKPSDVSNKGWIVLRSSNIQDGNLDFSDIVRVNVDVPEKLHVRENDIIICARNGSKKLVGKSALVKEIKEPMTFGAFMALCRTPFYSYMSMYLLSPLFFDQLRKESDTTTINQLTQKNFNKYIVPLPPLAEQKRIVEKIEELMPKVEEYGKAQNKLNKLNEELPERLKKSILQEAIEGRLVPQDPNDEPALVLLDKIREEKKQLVKEGKLKKKDLEEKAIPEDEIPFEIPESWEWVRIEDYTNKVTDYVASGSFASLRENVKYYKEENYALLVKTKDFQNDFSVDLTFTDEKGYAFLENSNLFGGELILSNVGSIDKIFVVPYLNRKMTLAPNAIMVRLWNDNHRDWLFYLFQSSFGISSLYEISSATAIRKFNKTDFKKLIIPLPPLAEQKRIVEKIEQLFKEVDKLK